MLTHIQTTINTLLLQDSGFSAAARVPLTSVSRSAENVRDERVGHETPVALDPVVTIGPELVFTTGLEDVLGARGCLTCAGPCKGDG